MTKRNTISAPRKRRLQWRQRNRLNKNRFSAATLFASSVAVLAAIVVTAFATPSAAYAQKDSLSSKVSSAAPDSCLTWYQWANPYNANAASENALDRMMAEPDVNKFCKDFTDKLGQLPAILIPDGAPPQLRAAAATIAPQLIDGILRNQGCFFVEGFELTPGQVPNNLKLGLVLELGDNADKTIQAISSLLRITDAPLEKLAFGDLNGLKITMPPNGPFATVGMVQHDGYLVAATSVEMTKQIVDRMKRGQVTGWLNKMQTEQKHVRTAVLGTMDVAALKNQLMPLANEQVVKTIKALGLNNLEKLEFSGGYAQTDYAQQLKIKFDGAPTGIFATFGDQGITDKDLAHFPADSFAAMAFSIDGRKVLDEFTNILVQLDPDAAKNVASGMIEIQSDTGIDLRKLFSNVGPTFTLHNGYSDGLLSGAQFRTTIQDPAWFEKTIESAMQLVQMKAGVPLSVDSIEQNGKTVKTMHFGGMPIPVEPSWMMNGDQMTMTLFPSVMASASKPDLVTPLIKEKSFAPYLHLLKPASSDEKVIAFSYMETNRGYEVLYTYACLASAAGKNMLAGPLEQSLPLPFSSEQIAKVKAHLSDLQLPSCRSIVKHLTPQVGVVRKEKEAIVFEMHSPIATSNLSVATTGIAIGMILPAVQTVREAARRTTSMNNLRQLTLASHNYESAYLRFPSGDGPVKPGGPAVSWRVKILPYIEENNLYQQYNFDEPWDSENNMKIAKQMPATFMNPQSIAQEGFTVYRGIGGVSGIMGVNAEGESVGRRFRDISDGASNTIMFVECPDQMAVPWTKPDGGINPAKISPRQLQGNFIGGFNTSFCDGSTRFIETSLDTETFKALLGFNDGIVTNFGK